MHKNIYEEAATINGHLYDNNQKSQLTLLFSSGSIREKMEKYVCTVCGYTYDPEKGDPDNGIKPGTKFKDLPDDWVCPVCGAAKDAFEKE